EEALDVGEERDLEFVDEERAGRVHRPERDEPFPDVEAPGKFHHSVGQIDELDALIRLHDERFAVNRKATDLRRCHIFDGLLANGDSRTLAHALPFGCFGEPAPLFRTRANNVTKKQHRVATLLYSPAVWSG